MSPIVGKFAPYPAREYSMVAPIFIDILGDSISVSSYANECGGGREGGYIILDTILHLMGSLHVIIGFGSLQKLLSRYLSTGHGDTE